MKDTLFAYNLRKEMDRLGINATKLEQLSGFPKVALYRYLKGQQPSYEKILQLAKILCISPDKLLRTPSEEPQDNGVHLDSSDSFTITFLDGSTVRWSSKSSLLTD